MMMRLFGTVVFFLSISALLCGKNPDTASAKNRYDSYKGLVMAGYQGWHCAEGDESGRGWFHYGLNRSPHIAPGSISIEFWPEMSEYEKKYKTPFTYPDGSPAYLYSSNDESTVDLHFKWMQQYGIDGAFMQRFAHFIDTGWPEACAHTRKVWNSAYHAAEKYDRAVCAMYDLSGQNPKPSKNVIKDWKWIVDHYPVKDRSKCKNYLYHNGKPLVAIWGIGFTDRKVGFEDINELIDFFLNDPQYGGCAIMVGVPACWRTPRVDDSDCKDSPEVMKIIDKIDIVAPWHVDRYRRYYLRDKNYDFMFNQIKGDIAWCREHGKDYVPGIYPGFSMLNLRGFKTPDNPRFKHWSPRLKGEYMWMMAKNNIRSGAEMLYVSMFDEIDEGTAIYKVSNRPPSSDPFKGGTYFFDNEGMPSDHYLWLTGTIAKILRGELPLTEQIPQRLPEH